MKNYKSFIRTGEFLKHEGWGILKCSIDDTFDLWAVESHTFIDEKQLYDYGLFVDYISEFPVYFFVSFDAAKDFAKIKPNRYPIDRQQYWLKFHQEWWFGTCAAAYIDYLSYLRSAEHLMNLKNRLK